MNGLRISELAQGAGLSTSTVRYYERIGLVPAPERTAAGYRTYDPQAQARLLFITRGKRMGLSLEDIAELITIWDGTNCGQTKDRLADLLQDKREELRAQIRELRSFEAQLAEVQRSLADSAAPETCDPDLGCCAPALGDIAVPVALTAGKVAEGDGGSEPIPIACTLTPDERPAREAAIRALLDQAAGWERTTRSLVIRFSATADIAKQVAALSEQEAACCAFLEFRARQHEHELVWEITAPGEEAAPVIDDFAALLPGLGAEEASPR